MQCMLDVTKDPVQYWSCYRFEACCIPTKKGTSQIQTRKLVALASFKESFVVSYW